MAAPDEVDTTAAPDEVDTTAAPDEEAAAGALVELHDGAYAVVLDTDPVRVLRLGVPELHEVPFTRTVG